MAKGGEGGDGLVVRQGTRGEIVGMIDDVMEMMGEEAVKDKR